MYTPITGTGSGIAPVVNLTWPFLDQDHVHATVAGATAAITFTGPSQVTFAVPVSSGIDWKIYRDTPVDAPLVDYTAGAVLTESDLDLAQNQMLYAQQELEYLFSTLDVSIADTLLSDALDAAARAEAAAAAATAGGQQVLNGLVTGGQVFWESAYTFRISAATYYINGTLYSSAEQTVTLTAADASLDRIDVLVLTSGSIASKVTGTAASTPSQPDIDPATQLRLTFVLVAAASSAPAGVANENIYLENTEWTTTVAGAGWTAASTTNPYAGTKDIDATGVLSTTFVKFVRASPIAISNYSSVGGFIRVGTAFPAGRGMRAQWFLGGVAKGTPQTIATGYWGFDGTVVSGLYQFISIPISQFVLPAGQMVDELRITVFGGALTFKLDNIILQGSTTAIGGGGGGSSGLSQDQADARYHKLAPQGQSIVSNATVTPTFSDDYVEITAQAAALNLANPTGTAIPHWAIEVRIKDNGTARAITYGTQYRAVGITLPTTTVIGKVTYLAMIWNSTATKWDVVAVAQEA